MSKPAFFIVFSPEGEAPPVKVHTSHKAAFGIAHRMAEAHPGQTFHVMVNAGRGVCCTPDEPITDKDIPY